MNLTMADTLRTDVDLKDAVSKYRFNLVPKVNTINIIMFLYFIATARSILN